MVSTNIQQTNTLSTNNHFPPNHPPLLQCHPHHLPPPLFNHTHHCSMPLHKPISAHGFRPHTEKIQCHMASPMDERQQWMVMTWHVNRHAISLVFASSVLWTEKIHRTKLYWTVVWSIFRLWLPKFGVIPVAGCLIQKSFKTIQRPVEIGCNQLNGHIRYIAL